MADDVVFREYESDGWFIIEAKLGSRVARDAISGTEANTARSLPGLIAQIKHRLAADLRSV